MRTRGIVISGIVALGMLGCLVWAADRAIRIDRSAAVCAKLGQQVQVDFALTLTRGLEIEASCLGKKPAQPV